MTGRPAVFLDRDGTVTEPRHHPGRPTDLVLQPGIGPPLRTLRDRGAALVLVTNQSGLARGLFTPRDLDRMHTHLRRLLDGLGVALDGIYVCPHHQEGVVRELAVRCACRKPRAGLLQRAARELALDLARSWMVGDAASDIEAGRRAGCCTAWVGAGAVPGAVTDVTGPVRPTLRSATTAGALHAVAAALGHDQSDHPAGANGGRP